MGIQELKTEIEYFEEVRAELLKTALGKFTLIKGRECHGTFDTEENAYTEGIRLFGSVPFLIQQVMCEDPVADLPAHFLGLVNAGI